MESFRNQRLFRGAALEHQLRYSVALNRWACLIKNQACQLADTMIAQPKGITLSLKSGAGLLQRLAVLRNIQAFDLMLAGDAERHEQADSLQKHIGGHARPDEGDQDTGKLGQRLHPGALECA